MNKQRKTSHILNVFQYDDATGIIGLNGVPVSGYGLYLHTDINDGSVGIDSSASINALYLLKNTTKQFEISYDTSGATKLFRLLPYQSGSFFQIGNPSNAANSNSDYVFISESVYGNVLIGPGIGNATGNLTGATASIHKVQFNGAVFANNSIQATSFKITGGVSTGFLKADGTVDAVTYLSGNQSITVSGDATGSGTTSIALTLANTAVTPGSYGSTTLVPVVTVDSKGRITSVTTAAISGSLTFTGDVTGTGTTGTSTALTLAASGVTAGTYTKVTVDTKGRVTVGASATTSDISEGTNLYYTDARVLSYLSANTYATQSYVNTQVSNLVAAAPATLDTLNELAAALGNDPSFATTISTSLGNRLRVDINTQGLSATLQGYGRTNLGLGTAATSNTGDFVAYRTFGTAANSAIGDFVAYRTFGTAANNNTGDFALASHTHSIANVTGLQTALDGKQASGSYAASSHSHIISDVTGLQTALDGKQASLGFTPYNSTNPSGYISSYTETSTLANVTARGASTSTRTTFTEVGATREGSDSVAAGPWFRWTNVAESRQMLTQLNASFGLTTWAYNGSAWVSAMTLTQAGALSLTSTISASNFSGSHSGSSSGTNTGDQTNISGNAATASNASALGGYAQDFQTVVGTGDYLIIRNQAASKLSLASWASVQSGLGLGSLAYSSATIPTNNNQLTNGAGYITGYSETDTLSSVTGRGATTSSPITINGGGAQPLALTTANGSPWHIALVRNDLGLTSRVFAHNSPYNGWYFEHNISIAGNTNWHSGNLTNLNQLTNGPGYITSSGSISGNAATATGQQSGAHFTLNTGGGGYGLVGVYNPDIHQGFYAMGPAYVLGAGGTLANFYGVSWSYDYSGRQLNTGYNLQHCMAVVNAGTVYTVIGQGIWTSGVIRANGAISAGGTISASNFSGSHSGTSSGTNTGDQTNISGNSATTSQRNFDGSLTSPDFYASGWFRTSGSTAGLYNSTHNTHFYASGTGQWNFATSNGSWIQIALRPASHESTTRGYLYADTSNNVGLLTYDGNWGLRVDTNKNVQIYGSVSATNLSGTNTGDQTNISGNAATATTAARATRANGNFYIDDNYGNTIVGVYESTRYQGVFAMGDAYKLPANGTSTGNLYGLAWSHPNAGGVAGNLNDHGLLVINNGVFAAAISSSIRAAADMRAPIFYDSNDTGYYLDPNGTSNLQTWTADTAARLGRSSYWTNRWAIYGVVNGHMTGTNGWGMDHGGWGTAWKGGFSGWDIWGTSTDHPQGSGYVHAQGIISGQHAASSDGSTAYGWMMVGAHNATDNRYWLRGKWGGSTSGWVEMVTSGNIASQTVSNSDMVDGYHASNFLGYQGNSYYQVNTWLQMNGSHGMYWPSYYGAHIYVNTSTSYTQIRIDGVKNGYDGVYLGSSGVNGMMYDTAGNGGVYRESTGRWYWYHYIPNNCMGINTSTTSSSYGLYVSGGIYSTGDIVAYSDRRKKTDIVTIDSALLKVKEMRGVFYTRTDDSEKIRQVGVIAQEINNVLPEAVTYAADVDEYGVKYGNIVGVLIEAIKEQQLQIEKLQNKLDNVLSSR
jgi:hypothetical protein